jgi:segregation and condensation protein A
VSADEPGEDWEAAEADYGPRATEERLTLDIDGWEGPLDVLLELARSQKVDLRAISILELVEQYLVFIDKARTLRLELAADYLVMAAWLAYLKSALLLPDDPDVEPSPRELALRLQLRLQRLDAMREAGARLMARDRLGRDLFMRGAPEGLRQDRRREWRASLFDLLQGYARVTVRREPAVHVVGRRPVVALDEALANLSATIGAAIEWRDIEQFLPADAAGPYRKSALASTFLAALELARQGRLEMSQAEAFAPLRLKSAQ